MWCLDFMLIFSELSNQEWPEESYPPYANGPGYILSYDIAKFIVDDFEQKRLRVSYPLRIYKILR